MNGTIGAVQLGKKAMEYGFELVIEDPCFALDVELKESLLALIVEAG